VRERWRRKEGPQRVRDTEARKTLKMCHDYILRGPVRSSRRDG